MITNRRGNKMKAPTDKEIREYAQTCGARYAEKAERLIAVRADAKKKGDRRHVRAINSLFKIMVG